MSHGCLEVFICDVSEVDGDVVIGAENGRLQRFGRHLRRETPGKREEEKWACFGVGGGKPERPTCRPCFQTQPFL